MRAIAVAWLTSVLLFSSAALAEHEEHRAVGVWELSSDWGKGGDKGKGKHILTIGADLTGTVKDLQKDSTSEIHNLKTDGDSFSFSFFYDAKNEYEIQFSGKVIKESVEGKFSFFGTDAVVSGARVSADKAARLAKKRSVFGAFEARRFKSSEGNTLSYRLFVPTNYDPKKKYPLALFHHGGGGAGSDNRSQLEGACVKEWHRPEAQAKNSCFIIAPQFPGKKSKGKQSFESAVRDMKLRIRTIHEILDHLESEFSIDKDREYVTGLSFGGECTWLSLLERPDRFAAAVPICAGKRLMEISDEERGKRFAKLPLWIFHGDADKVISVADSRSIVKALRDAGGEPRYTEYKGVGHNSWDKAYRDPKLIDWLFAQSRKSEEQRKK